MGKRTNPPADRQVKAHFGMQRVKNQKNEGNLPQAEEQVQPFLIDGAIHG